MGKKQKPEKTKSKSKSVSKRGSIRSYTSEKSYTAVPKDGSETEGSQQPSRRGSGTSRKHMHDVASSKRLRKKPSPVVAPLPILTQDEYEFFDMVKTGDVNSVQDFLSSEEFQNMDINKINQFGYTVLHEAVRRQDENMVKLLLEQPGINLYDTILHAIREENMPILKMLLQAHDKTFTDEAKERLASKMTGSPEELRRMMTTSMTAMIVSPTASPISLRSGINTSVKRSRHPGFGPTRTHSGAKSKKKFPHTSILTEDVGDEKAIFDSEFPEVVTPLMIAAQTGSIEIMELFYSRDERLESPEFAHNIDCPCDICTKLEGDHDLTRAHQRCELFKSIAEPAYICFIARKEKIDPVNYALQKLIKIRQICERETAYDTMYTKFLDKLEQFLCDLLSLCRNTTEAEIFLSPKDPGEKERLPHAYPRLWYAVGLDLKKFVSQSSFQLIVYKMWATDDWPDWDTYGLIFKLFNLVIRLVAFPIIALILCLAPESGIGRILGSPISRFLTYIASYVFFLCLVTFQVMFPYQRCNDEEPYYQVRDDQCTQRGPPRLGTEWPIIIYVLSFYVSTLKRQSVSWYWSMKWNWFELFGWIFFTATFASWCAAWVWTQLPENENLIFATERGMWPQTSPEVFGECFLAMSTMFAFGNLLRFLLVLPTAGPVQVGIGRQIVNFFMTGLIYAIVLIGFASGLLALYVPYKGFKGYDKDGKEGTQDATFTNFLDCLQNLFWFLYGKGGKNVPAHMVKWELPGNQTSTGQIVPKRVHHEYTEHMGLMLYHGYHIVGQMMMFSMLSAYFAKTIEHYVDSGEIVWKYARTELYLTFVKDTALPPPFNLIPTIKSLLNAIKFFSYLGRKEDPKSGCSFRQCCFITESEKKDRWSQLMQGYRKLIVELIFRYHNFRSESKAASDATKDDVLEIGEALAEMKAELEKFRKKSKGSLGGGGGPDDKPSGGSSKRWPKPMQLLKPSDAMQTGKSGSGNRTGGGTSRDPGASSATMNQPTSTNQNNRSNAAFTRQPTATSMQTAQQTQVPSRTTNMTPPRSPQQAASWSSPTQATAQQIATRSSPLSKTTTKQEQVRYSPQQTAKQSPLSAQQTPPRSSPFSTQQSPYRSSPLTTQQTPTRSSPLTTQQMGSRSSPLSTQKMTSRFAPDPSYTTATAQSETASQSASVSSAQTTQSRPRLASNTSTSQPQPSSVPFSTSTRGADASFDGNLNKSASPQVKSQPIKKKASPIITPLMPQPRRFNVESETTDSSTTTPK